MHLDQSSRPSQVDEEPVIENAACSSRCDDQAFKCHGQIRLRSLRTITIRCFKADQKEIPIPRIWPITASRRESIQALLHYGASPSRWYSTRIDSNQCTSVLISDNLVVISRLCAINPLTRMTFSQSLIRHEIAKTLV